MGTKVTSSSGSVLEESEIQKLQMQAKNSKENSLNKLNALKTTIQHLSSSNHSMYYEFREAFHRLFDANEGLFRSVLSRNMQNLEMQFSNETLHEKDSNSELRAIKGQFEHFIHSKMFELSKYNTNAREILQDFNAYTTMEAQTFKETIIQNMNSIEQCIIERASHEQELKMTLKKLSERQLQIQQCKVQEVQSSVTSSGDETSSGIVSDEEIEKKELEAHYGFMAKIQEVLPAESSSTDTPLEQVQNNDEKNVFANERQHSEKHAAECADERAALANLIANLTLDTEENKTILKQLKKANASLTQELEECKTNLDETSRALGEATSSRDSCLIALQTKQTELEKYTALNDRTTWSNHTNSAFPNPTAKSMEVLIKTLLMPLSNKTILDSHCFVHELKREMHDDLEYVKSLEKEIDELESEKADFSNIYDLLLEECVSKDVTCSYLHSLSDLNAHTGLQCLYLHKVKECECLAQKLSKQTESVNKEVHNNLLKSFIS
ncbi:hypothetical protein Tco_0228586 [Tanacetum coccineum]